MVSGDDADPLTSYVRAQVDEVFAGLPELPDPLAVHHTRVALRRLRSTLRVFGPLLSLEPAQAGAADEELRWFAVLLGEVRDRQVQRARFEAALDALSPQEVLGPVAGRIEATLHAEQRQAEEEVTREIAGQRWADLADLLDTWRQQPPVADGDPDDVRRRARQAAKKAERRLAAACPDGTDAELHRARKAAKRARYAGEVLHPLGRGGRQRKRFKRLQVLLGEHQDAVVAASTLLRLTAALPVGESAFTFGLLYATEREQAARLRREVCGLVES